MTAPASSRFARWRAVSQIRFCRLYINRDSNRIESNRLADRRQQNGIGVFCLSFVKFLGESCIQ